MTDKRPLKITLAIPHGVELWIDKNRTVWIHRDLDAAKEADKFVELVQAICKQKKLRNRLKIGSKKAQVLGLRRIYNLPSD